ncbi:hypothetical protein SAICODRAFT_8683 [Saitoella complicata NRRL Y-17804]|nr:uncharacterized protein SAICODRAFT_8683 [Saitoella complicata NRRL Y-17804]ODQ51753.1 hypothetical protein SAICODRAFT_8683 [Saitoella complicata NRRL Y-17804]
MPRLTRSQASLSQTSIANEDRIIEITTEAGVKVEQTKTTTTRRRVAHNVVEDSEDEEEEDELVKIEENEEEEEEEEDVEPPTTRPKRKVATGRTLSAKARGKLPMKYAESDFEADATSEEEDFKNEIVENSESELSELEIEQEEEVTKVHLNKKRRITVTPKRALATKGKGKAKVESATPSIAGVSSTKTSPANATTPATSISVASSIKGEALDVDAEMKDVVADSGDDEADDPSFEHLSDQDQNLDLDNLSEAEDEEAELSDEDGNVVTVTATVESVATATTRRRVRRPRLSRYERTRQQLAVHHPELETVWDDLEQLAVTEVKRAEQPAGLSLSLLPFQLEGLHWLRQQEENPTFRGGVLADEMGMGKTIQTIALLLSTPGMKPSLVVAPTVALMQWKHEIEQHTKNGLSVLLYYGTAREKLTVEKICEYDVVLSSYGVLESAFRKQNQGFKRKDGVFKEDSLIHAVPFHRVILDEAHNIKDRSCNTAKSVFALKAEKKWCLSGTPLQNRVNELFSLLRFLELRPYSLYFCKKCKCKSLHWRFPDKRHCQDCGHRPMDHTCWFNAELLKPIQLHGADGEGLVAFKKLHKLMKRVMLRRTKVERADDIGLPPRVVVVRRDVFNEEEEDLYDSLYNDSKRKFSTYVAANTVLNNYANIFQLITRMRQMADHPALVLNRAGTAAEGAAGFVCRICDEEATDAIKSRCHHVFCRVCVSEYVEGAFEEHPECPVCHVTLNIDLTAPALEEDNEENHRRDSIINRIDMNHFRSSTKIEALVEELYKLRSKDSTIKSIVFSQFTNMLDLVHWRLRRAGYQCVKLDGHMTPQQRDSTIKHFMTDPAVTVFLVSLKAGGVALNLTEASHVFLLEPWWNGAAEWQSADRVHRIGQTRPVKITRFCIENSIESRVIELQEKKAAMIGAVVNQSDSALSRLSATDFQFLFH